MDSQNHTVCAHEHDSKEMNSTVPGGASTGKTEEQMMYFWSIETRQTDRAKMRKELEEKIKDEYGTSMRQVKKHMRSLGMKPTLNNMYRELILKPLEEKEETNSTKVS